MTRQDISGKQSYLSKRSIAEGGNNNPRRVSGRDDVAHGVGVVVEASVGEFRICAGEDTGDAAGGVQSAAQVGAAGVVFLGGVVAVEDGEDEKGAGEVDVAVDGAVGADGFDAAAEGVVTAGEDGGGVGFADDVGELVGEVVLVGEGGVGSEVAVGVVGVGGVAEDDGGGVGGRHGDVGVGGASVGGGEGVGAGDNRDARDVEGGVGVNGAGGVVDGDGANGVVDGTGDGEGGAGPGAGDDLVEVVEGIGDVEAESGAVDGVSGGVVAIAGGVGGAGGVDGDELVGVIVHFHRESALAARRKPQGPSR